MIKRRHSIAIFTSFLALALLQTGCAVLIGSIKPVEEKSESYGIADLSKEGPGWVKLDAAAESNASKTPEVTPTEVSDVAYQSKKTASIISLDSACRKSSASPDHDLKSFTNQLLLGISNIAQRNEAAVIVQNTPALETTVTGRVNADPVMLRTVVLRRGNCVYDLVFVARPNTFSEEETDFSHFVASLKLK
jgi:hypothetical protein